MNSVVLNYCKAMYLDLIDDELYSLNNSNNLKNIADKFLGYPVNYLDVDDDNKDTILEGIIIFMVVELDDRRTQDLSKAVNDHYLNLEEDFVNLFESEVIGIFPEFIPGTSIFEIQRHLKEWLNGENYYNALLEDEAILPDQEDMIKDLLVIKTEQNEDVALEMINKFSAKFSIKKEIVAGMAKIINQRPKLRVV